MTSPLDEAADRHSSVCVRRSKPPETRLVFKMNDNGTVSTHIVNNSRRYSQEELDKINEMVNDMNDAGKISPGSSTVQLSKFYRQYEAYEKECSNA